MVGEDTPRNSKSDYQETEFKDSTSSETVNNALDGRIFNRVVEQRRENPALLSKNAEIEMFSRKNENPSTQTEPRTLPDFSSTKRTSTAFENLLKEQSTKQELIQKNQRARSLFEERIVGNSTSGGETSSATILVPANASKESTKSGTVNSARAIIRSRFLKSKLGNQNRANTAHIKLNIKRPSRLEKPKVEAKESDYIPSGDRSRVENLEVNKSTIEKIRDNKKNDSIEKLGTHEILDNKAGDLFKSEVVSSPQALGKILEKSNYQTSLRQRKSSSYNTSNNTSDINAFHNSPSSTQLITGTTSLLAGFFAGLVVLLMLIAFIYN